MTQRERGRAPGGVPGAPAMDLGRSPATARIAQLAAVAGLRMMHFEHRVELAGPEAWEQGPCEGVWRHGVLHEDKYAGFRHDLLLGSFHPGHRGKWTGHELCHGLVGFAWRPGASRGWHGVAAHLAEVLPVALWYFLDEAGLGRCPRHRLGGALHRTYCRACERAAARPEEGSGGTDAWAAAASRFVRRELDAVAIGRRTGRLTSHVYGALDLAMDGLRYADAHHGRLSSMTFHRFVEFFFDQEGQGRCASHEALEARLLAVLGELEGEGAWSPASRDGAVVIAQDVGWRLLTVHAQCEGPAASALLDLVGRLATDAGTLSEVVAAYETLHVTWTLPPPELLFAVGYPLPGGYGSGFGQLSEGVRSACPGAVELLGEGFEDVVTAFGRADLEAFARVALGRRFSRWLRGVQGDGPGSALAAFEAATADPRPRDEVAQLLGTDSGPWRLSEGAEVLRSPLDVLGLAEAVGSGAQEIDVSGEPTSLVILRSLDEDVDVVPLSEPEGLLLSGLSEGETLDRESGLDEERLNALTEARVLVPACWELDAPTTP